MEITKKLSLDDPLWSNLKDAYGSASRIPSLLRELSKKTTPVSSSQEEPWFSLWSSLCHQGDIYVASYAAVPHIIELAHNADWPIDFSFLSLPASIEAARLKGKGPPVPQKLAEDYYAAIAKLPKCITRFIDEKWDVSFTHAASFALAVIKGHMELADKLDAIND